MSEPVTVVLKKPITIGKDKPIVITELTFRQLKAKDLRGHKLSGLDEMDTILAIAGRLSGQPNNVIDDLSGDDLAGVISLVSGFLMSSLKTGSEPSP